MMEAISVGATMYDLEADLFSAAGEALVLGARIGFDEVGDLQAALEMALDAIAELRGDVRGGIA